MNVEASDKPKFCVGNDDWRKLVSLEDYESDDDDDDDDIPLSQKMPWISSLGMCSSKHDASVKKRDTTTPPVKRVFNNNNSLCGSMKKSKVSPTLYNHNDDDYGVPLSKRLSRPSSLGMCSSKRDASVKKRDTTTPPDKRVFDNNNSLCGSMKKSKVSPTLYDHNDDEDDNDDVPLSKRLSRPSSLVTCSTKCDSSVKKSDTTTVPIRRVVDNSKSLCGSLKKPKVSPTPYDDNDDDDDDDDDDVPISSIIKMPAMSTDKSFSSLKKDIALVENSFEECKRMRQEEEKRLQSIKKDIEKFSKELGNKKIQVSCVRRINEIYKKMKGKIEECVKDFVVKEGKLYLMEELIGERKQELRQVTDNISKRKHFETQVKEFESKENRFERKVKEMVMDLVSMQAHFERQVKELESNKKQHEGRVKDHESKVREFEARVKELESGKEHFERRLKDLKSKKKQFEGQVREFQPKADEFNGLVKELESKVKLRSSN